jgi:hypothetical protein
MPKVLGKLWHNKGP